MTTLYKGDVVYDAIVCPLCSEHHCTILNETTYRCLDCHYDWHPPGAVTRPGGLVVPNYQNAPDPDPRPPPTPGGWQADEPDRGSDWSGIDGY